MTEITDLSTTDATNTSITGESLEGNVANMGRMENTLQAILGMLARSIRSNVFRLLDNTDATKKVAFDLSGLTTATTRTVTVPDASGTIDLINTAQTITGVKTLSAIPVMSGGGIKFPLSQVLSADPNTLDDYEEGTYSPPATSSIGTITSVSGSVGVYQKIGKYVYFKSSVSITNAGTGAGFLRIGLPFTPDDNFVAYGRETAGTGKQLQGQISSASTNMSVVFYDNTWPGATGNTIFIQGFFTTAS